MNDTTALKQKILKLADHCVKCGLCSTQCPTYRLKQDENESPRGRIAMAQALASNAISPGDNLQKHLDNCLQCRRCEASCPSEVAYGELMTLTSTLLADSNPQNSPRVIRLIARLSKLSHRSWQTLAKIWAFLSHIQALQLLRINKAGRVLFRLTTARRKTKKHSLTTITKKKMEPVFLFTGCISHVFDQQALQASVQLLEFCGYTVNIPNEQTCCGAIASRQGLAKIAQQCQMNNQHAFADPNNQPIIFFTPGCGSKLGEYDNHSLAETPFSSRTISISRFLNRSDYFSKIHFSPLKKRVLIFTPCSEKNILKQTGVTEALLNRIPAIELVNLTNNIGCCGASGLHLLTHQQQAEKIRQPTLDAIISLAPDMIVSTNFPCSLHLSSGLKEKNLDIPMMHPIELLFSQVNTERL